MDMRYHWMSLRVTMASVMDIKVCFTLIIIISFRYYITTFAERVQTKKEQIEIKDFELIK
jgi:hypothetical protein